MYTQCMRMNARVRRRARDQRASRTATTGRGGGHRRCNEKVVVIIIIIIVVICISIVIVFIIITIGGGGAQQCIDCRFALRINTEIAIHYVIQLRAHAAVGCKQNVTQFH